MHPVESRISPNLSRAWSTVSEPVSDSISYAHTSNGVRAPDSEMVYSMLFANRQVMAFSDPFPTKSEAQ